MPYTTCTSSCMICYNITDTAFALHWVLIMLYHKKCELCSSTNMLSTGFGNSRHHRLHWWDIHTETTPWTQDQVNLCQQAWHSFSHDARSVRQPTPLPWRDHWQSREGTWCTSFQNINCRKAAIPVPHRQVLYSWCGISLEGVPYYSVQELWYTECRGE